MNWITEDVGLLAFVLVKPIAQISLEYVSANPTIYNQTEKDFAIEAIGTLPEIKDDAYLNFIAHPAGTFATAVIHGMMETIWSD